MLLCENNQSYGVYGIFLGIPTPLILEIFGYVAADFFQINNLHSVGTTKDKSWLTPLYEQLLYPQPTSPWRLGTSRAEKKL
jgi:hypothetical protein